MTIIEDKIEHSNFYNGFVEVKSEPSNIHKYWGSYETSNYSKAHYINTHPHLMEVSSHDSQKLEF